MAAHESSTYFISMAGEFAVLSQLFQRGYLATLTFGNAKSVDILAESPSGRAFKIEVKTTRKHKPSVETSRSQWGSNLDWLLSKSAEDKAETGLYYVFVSLQSPDDRPRFFVVKSRQVANYVARQHREWIELSRRRGKPVKDNPMRVFRIGLEEDSHGLKPLSKYEDAWRSLPD